MSPEIVAEDTKMRVSLNCSVAVLLNGSPALRDISPRAAAALPGAWAVVSAEPGESGPQSRPRTTLTAAAEHVKPAEVQRACHLMRLPQCVARTWAVAATEPVAEPAEPATGDSCGALEVGRC